MKNKQKKMNNKKNIPLKATAFNPNFLIWLLGFGFTLWGNFYFYSLENKISWFLVAFLIVFIFALFADSVYYVFTKEEIYFVHFWGYKWRLPWLYVSSITKHGFWDSFGLRELMGYEVYYDQPHKGRVTRRTTLLALTPTVKKCLNKFYRGEIAFETKRRKKKR